MKITLPLILAGLLAGCATSPVTFTAAMPVSAKNLLECHEKYSRPIPESVRIVIVRDSGMLGAAVPAKLSIDGCPVAKLWSSERLELFLVPGDYIFAVEPSPRLGGALVEKDVRITEGKSYSFRISLDGSGSFSLQPSTHIQ